MSQKRGAARHRAAPRFRAPHSGAELLQKPPVGLRRGGRHRAVGEAEGALLPPPVQDIPALDEGPRRGDVPRPGLAGGKGDPRRQQGDGVPDVVTPVHRDGVQRRLDMPPELPPPGQPGEQPPLPPDQGVAPVASVRPIDGGLRRPVHGQGEQAGQAQGAPEGQRTHQPGDRRPDGPPPLCPPAVPGPHRRLPGGGVRGDGGVPLPPE